MFAWFHTFLAWLFFGSRRQRLRILFVGLDNAGKTTLLHQLRYGRFTAAAPTEHAQCETVKVGKLEMCAHDVGGHDVVRELWKEYFGSIDAIVFLVDANDRERLAESRDELHKIFVDEQAENIPVLILGNKIDLRYAASEGELVQQLSLNGWRSYGGDGADGRHRAVELFMVSVLKQHGYQAAFEWLRKATLASSAQ